MENWSFRKVKNHTQDHTGSETAAPAGSPACVEGKCLGCYQAWTESWWCHLCDFTKLLNVPAYFLLWLNGRDEKNTTTDFPGGPMDETPCSQSRGPRFDPWSGNWIPHASTKILHSTTKKVSHVPQWRLKIPRATTKTQCSQINKYIYIFRAYHFTCLLRNCMWAKKQQLEPYLEQLTSSKLGKE